MIPIIIDSVLETLYLSVTLPSPSPTPPPVWQGGSPYPGSRPYKSRSPSTPATGDHLPQPLLTKTGSSVVHRPVNGLRLDDLYSSGAQYRDDFGPTPLTQNDRPPRRTGSRTQHDPPPPRPFTESGRTGRSTVCLSICLSACEVIPL